MNHLETAIKIACEAHFGQKTKYDGKPYILHPLFLMSQFKDEKLQIIAVLHDVIEDCDDYDIGILRKIGFSEDILEALEALTHPKGESYEKYIRRVAQNKMARKVKLKDLEHNMDPTRVINKYIEKYQIRYKKYQKAYRYLLFYQPEEK